MSEGTEWKPLVSFADQSESYVHGFEAGMIWQRMQSKEPEIEATVHVENEVTIINMANATGYAAEFESVGVDGWSSLLLTLRPATGHLSVVEGQSDG